MFGKSYVLAWIVVNGSWNGRLYIAAQQGENEKGGGGERGWLW